MSFYLQSFHSRVARSSLVKCLISSSLLRAGCARAARPPELGFLSRSTSRCRVFSPHESRDSLALEILPSPFTTASAKISEEIENGQMGCSVDALSFPRNEMCSFCYDFCFTAFNFPSNVIHDGRNSFYTSLSSLRGQL